LSFSPVRPSEQSKSIAHRFRAYLCSPLSTIQARFSGLAWCFLAFLRFLRQKAIEGALQGTHNGSYGKWIGFSGMIDR
ncbi:hypothetical protein V4Y02_24185, partial [Escherichia coli]